MERGRYGIYPGVIIALLPPANGAGNTDQPYGDPPKVAGAKHEA